MDFLYWIFGIKKVTGSIWGGAAGREIGQKQGAYIPLGLEEHLSRGKMILLLKFIYRFNAIL